MATATRFRPFVWTASYSVGVPSIDAQHKKLVQTVARLQSEMMKGARKETLGAILSELVRYTAEHFQHEERLMRVNGYPGLQRHVVEHRKLTDQVKAFVTDYHAGKITLSISLLQFLKEWLNNHILESDKKYGPLLVKKGAR